MFVLMTAKEQLNTRDGKPYFRVGFRDGGREVAFPIWDNSPWAVECRDKWTPGAFYKVRAIYRETNYGPQLDIRKIREVCDADAADGFDPTAASRNRVTSRRRCSTRCWPIVRERITDAPLRALVEKILRRQPRRAFADSGRAAQSSCLRRGLAGAHAERDADGDLPCRQVRGILRRHAAAAGQVDGRGRRDPARHRQAPRVGAAARRRGLHGRRRADRPLAARPRHRPRGGGRVPLAGRRALAAGAPDHRPSAAARMGLAQAADDARSPAWSTTPTTSTPSST